MPVPPIFLNTATIKNASLAEKVSLARQCGFDGLEMWVQEIAPQLLSEADVAVGAARYMLDEVAADVDPVALSELLDRNELAIDGVIPGSDVLQRWSGELDAGLIDSLAATMRTCATLGVRYLVLPTIADEGSLERVALNLREIGALAREHGIRLGLEPIGQTRLVNGVKDALVVLETAGLDDAAGIILDAFHFFRAGQDLSDLATLQSDRIVAVQINDAIEMPLESMFGNRHRDFPGEGIFDVTGFCEAVGREVDERLRLVEGLDQPLHRQG